MKKYFTLALGFVFITKVFSQTPDWRASCWVDSVFTTLNQDEKIAQLMMLRVNTNWSKEKYDALADSITKYKIGALCFFKGDAIKEAQLINRYQQITSVPLLIAMDAEWGVGMRLTEVTAFPHQLMMGALPNASLVYDFGKIVGQQCNRMNIHINFAPDVDVNNNPNNPVINDRSFGENKYTVALYGSNYAKGMQEQNVVACAKHFPGHGDVAMDSHLDLPIILKSRAQLDSLELYPFKVLIHDNVSSIMVAHLYVPAIDSTKNLATSLSKKCVTDLLKCDLHYQGIVFSDALDMQGVTKFFSNGDASAQALIAGVDMLCLPSNIPLSIKKINIAINENKITWTEVNTRVKKILLAKYYTGLSNTVTIDTTNLVANLNAQIVSLKEKIIAQSVTLLRQEQTIILPLKKRDKILYVLIGKDSENYITKQLQLRYPTTRVIAFNYHSDITAAQQLIDSIKQQKDIVIIVGLHNFSRMPTNNFQLSKPAIYLLNELAKMPQTQTFIFGNPYVLTNVSGEATNLLLCYEDGEQTQRAALNFLEGDLETQGSLPVTASLNYKLHDGILRAPALPFVAAATVGMDATKMNKIDSIAQLAIEQNATPSCAILVAKNGTVVYQKSFGYTTYDKTEPVRNDMVYDLASVTKTTATTLAVMKLYENKQIEIKKTIGDYLAWTRGTDKAAITIKELLLHESGLTPYISFFKNTVDNNTANKILPQYFSKNYDAQHTCRVAENIYLRSDYRDTICKNILESHLGEKGKYLYSDINAILLGFIVEAITQQNLNDYLQQTFYRPMQMLRTSFLPIKIIPLSNIVPTENDTYFRRQLLRGDVHDESAAMLGGIAGNAGLYSNTYDLAKLYQMLLNGGTFNNVRYLKESTIKKFTAYNSKTSRRALGFDKPKKTHTKGEALYPASYCSKKTFGHTGFTGTCVWVDPKKKLVYIFLANSVYPTRSNKIVALNTRSNIFDAIYESIK